VPVKTTASAKPQIVLASSDPEVEKAVSRAGLPVHRVVFSAFDEKAAAAISQFEGYNRAAAGQRVADLVEALTDRPNAILIADGEAGVAGLLAAAVAPVSRAILDVGRFDTTSDAVFLDRLYISGIRRAGDLHTAASMVRGTVVVHNAGDRFSVEGPVKHPEKLSPEQIVQLVKKRQGS
jgi:hypothetical protein